MKYLMCCLRRAHCLIPDWCPGPVCFRWRQESFALDEKQPIIRELVLDKGPQRYQAVSVLSV